MAHRLLPAAVVLVLVAGCSGKRNEAPRKVEAAPAAPSAAPVSMAGTDLSEITALIEDTHVRVNDALRGDDLAAMEAALATLNDTAVRIDDFERIARRNGESEDEVAQVLRSLKWPDVYAQGRNLRDRIVIKKHQ